MKTSILCYLLTLFALSITGATVINRIIPLESYRPGNFPFKVREFEKKLFRRLRVNRWKDYLPQNNRDFDKSQIAVFDDPEYIRTFILQTCRGETVHFLLGVSSFALIPYGKFSPEPEFAYRVLTILSTIYFNCQMPFIWVQRFNRPRLEKLLKIVTRKSIRKNRQARN